MWCCANSLGLAQSDWALRLSIKIYGWKTEHAKHADDRASKQHKYI